MAIASLRQDARFLLSRFRRLKIRSDVAAIFLFHTVEWEPTPWTHGHRYITPFDAFREQIAFLREHFEVVPTMELVRRQRAGTADRPLAAIHFDNGFATYDTVALPYLKQLNVPSTVFLIHDVLYGAVPTRNQLAFLLNTGTRTKFLRDLSATFCSTDAATFSGMTIAGALAWLKSRMTPQREALARAPLSEAQVALVAEAVYTRCDAADGLADGLIDDPRRCDFDPAAHLPICAGSASDSCFTRPQIETLVAIYSGPAAGGKQLFPGQPVGAEAAGGWSNWIVSDDGGTTGTLYATSFFRYMAFTPDEPDFDWREFDFAADPARVTIRETLDATDPDLSAFHDRGGKMITYFGWADTALNPMMGVEYYEAVQAKMGATTTLDFYRLFMVPGMLHCRGGLGTGRIDALTPLVNWVEGNLAPAMIPAERVEAGEVTRSRPLCPYPKVARYGGSGSVDDSGNFACTIP